MYMRIITHIKSHPYLYGIIGIVSALTIYSVARPNTSSISYDSAQVLRGDLTQEVEVTGKVRPSQERDLAFQRSGVVDSVLKNVGDTVFAGDRIAKLDTSELSAQLLQAQAQIEQAENTLVELKRGSRPEEIALTQTAVENAERSLEDAQQSLELVKNKAATDLASVYDASISTAQSGVIVAKSGLITLSTLQYSRFISGGVSTESFSSLKGVAVYDLFGVNSAENWTASAVSELQDGVYGNVRDMDDSLSYEEQEEALQDTLSALRSTSEALGAMPILDTFTATEKTELSSARSSLSSSITALASALQSIGVQEAANTSLISTAEAAVTTAENILRQAENELSLKEAGSTVEAIATQESRVRSAFAQKDLILSQINSMILTSPITGVVTKQEAKTGSFAQAGTPLVSVISDGGFEIETYVPEVDIAKIEVGDITHVTLDAYDDAVVFEASVAAIDPAETVIEGVSTYKVTVVFADPEDPRIRSGMTADVTIVTDMKEDVLIVPTRSIVREDGNTYLRKVSTDGSYENVEVEVGLRGSSGNSEIIGGIEEGDEIVTFVRE
jgi:RND family efflux transporter MFP subunit